MSKKNSDRSGEKLPCPNLIIDGYNLIHALPAMARFVGTDLQRARELLLMKLSGYASRNRIKITVVFDGQRGKNPVEHNWPGLTVVFSQGKKADHFIKELVQKIANKKDWLVITSDFDIRFQVDGVGIKSRSARDFAAELEAFSATKKNPARRTSDSSEEKKMTKEDMDWAYEVFLKNKKG